MNNIHQHLDLIAGLPEEDYASFRQSFIDVMSVRPEQFQLGFLKLLKGSGLRENAKSFGLVYKEEPPYEILYTSSISYDEILRLHGIDELVDKYYNSGRFTHALEYLFECFGNPFDFFEQFSIFWEAKGYDLMDHNKIAYYKHLITFGTEHDAVNEELLKEWIRYDYLLNEPINEMPQAFETINREELKAFYNDLLKRDEWISKNLPHLLPLAPRQRYKVTHLEAFYYPIGGGQIEGLFSIKRLDQPQKILFDYSTLPPKMLLVEEESL